MTTTLARIEDVAGPGLERVIAAGFLASYREPTRSHYAAVLKQWIAWCHAQGFDATRAQRAHIELWARHLEEDRGLQLSTVAGKLNAVCGMYRYAHMDGHLKDNPGRWVKRPKVSQISRTVGLTRSELLAILDLAEHTDPQDHAICCILGFNGLRVGELCSLRVDSVRRQGSYNIQNSVGHNDPRQITRYDRNKNDLSRNATHMVSAYVEGS